MELFNGDNDFCNIQTSLVIREVVGFKQMREEFTTLHKFQHQVELLRCLKGVVKRSQERLSDDLLENLKQKRLVDFRFPHDLTHFSFSFGMLCCFLLSRHLHLIQDLHRIVSAVVQAALFSHQENFTISASAEKRQERKVFHSDLVSGIDDRWKKFRISLSEVFIESCYLPVDLICDVCSRSSSSS